MSEHSKTSTPKGGNTHPSGPRGWPPAAARPYSSAAHAMRTSTTTDAQQDNHDEHWKAGCHGNRARPVWRGAVGKGPPQRGTSSAAYPTSRTVLRAAAGEIPAADSPPTQTRQRMARTQTRRRTLHLDQPRRNRIPQPTPTRPHTPNKPRTRHRPTRRNGAAFLAGWRLMPISLPVRLKVPPSSPGGRCRSVWNRATRQPGQCAVLIICSFMIRNEPRPWRSLVARGRAK